MFSIKAIFKNSYELYTTRFTTIAGITAIVVLFSLLFEQIITDIFEYSIIVGIIFAVLFGVVAVIFEIGYTKYMLKLVSGGAPMLEDLLKYSYLFWRYIFSSILLGLVILGGFILLIVPGIYFALRFLFVPILIVDKEVRIREAFARSTQLTKGSKWKLLWFMLILILIPATLAGPLVSSLDGNLVIEIAASVFVTPFLLVAYIKTYRTLQGLE